MPGNELGHPQPPLQGGKEPQKAVKIAAAQEKLRLPGVKFC
jgi:hypothetical protein